MSGSRGAHCDCPSAIAKKCLDFNHRGHLAVSTVQDGESVRRVIASTGMDGGDD